MLTFKQYINEMPLPQDWDKEKFKGSYKKQIDYALENSTKIGSGSSRVAFIIPFEGRETVLKVAKNAKGLAQNEREADYGLHNMHGGVLIPLIDHDEDNDPPRWIHFEKAGKLTDKNFKLVEGYSFKDFGYMLMNWQNVHKGKRPIYHIDEEVYEQIEESELFQEVTDMVGNYGFLVGDFTRLANWGMWKGKPVIIDYGFDEQIQKEYYSPKKPVQRGW